MVLVGEGDGADEHDGQETGEDRLVDPLDACLSLLVPVCEHQVRRIVAVRKGEPQGRPEGDPLRDAFGVFHVRAGGRFLLAQGIQNGARDPQLRSHVFDDGLVDVHGAGNVDPDDPLPGHHRGVMLDGPLHLARQPLQGGLDHLEDILFPEVDPGVGLLKGR